MKVIYRIALIASAFLFAACSQTGKLPENDDSIDITVKICGPETTRATDIETSDESKVGNLQVFVFREGRLEDYRDAGTATSATLTVTAGERTVWALVNAPSLTGILTEEQLAGAASQLSENRRDALVMSGSLTRNLTDGATVSVTVRRLVSRVSVGKVTTGFRYALEDADLQLDALWLVNVAADARFGEDGAPGQWANRLGHTDSSLDPLLFDRVDAVVNNAAPYERAHVFYPYPNPTEDSVYTDDWCPRHTMLVVEVTLEGKKGYYPVELPVLERNRSYVIGEIHITRRPGEVPYVPVETGEATVPVVVKEWENEVNLGTITI